MSLVTFHNYNKISAKTA